MRTSRRLSAGGRLCGRNKIVGSFANGGMLLGLHHGETLL